MISSAGLFVTQNVRQKRTESENLRRIQGGVKKRIKSRELKALAEPSRAEPSQATDRPALKGPGQVLPCPFETA